MKVSNETKVGALTAIAITLFILGFNYLKGRNITNRSKTIYAVFSDVSGLTNSSPVYVNGFQVGRVIDMEEKDIALSGIVVGIDLSKDYMIPKDSYAFIDKGLLGDPSIKLVMGKSNQYVVDGDSLVVQPTTDLVGDLKKTLSPALDNLNATMTSVQTTLQKFNEILNPATQENIRSMIAHLNETTAALEILMDPKNGKLANSLTHIEHITGNLDKNSGKIDTTLTHLQTFSENLSQADITALVKDLKNTLAALDKTIVQVNDPKGSVGALLHERSLHNELQQTSRSLTILLDDLKTHPKRYINISVFGKKDKSTPLSKPLYDSTLK